MDLFNRDMKTVATCKVKPYELVERDQEDEGGDEKDQGEKDDKKKVVYSVCTFILKVSTSTEVA